MANFTQQYSSNPGIHIGTRTYFDIGNADKEKADTENQLFWGHDKYIYKTLREQRVKYCK